MDPRQKAIEELKKQIAAQRARIDPEVLEKAHKAALQSQKPKAQREAGMVPFDREAATRAVAQFVQNSEDPAALASQLRDLLLNR